MQAAGFKPAAPSLGGSEAGSIQDEGKTARGEMIAAVRVLAASVATTLLMAAGIFPGAAETSIASGAQRGANPPPPWRSYPLNQVESNLAAQARQDACDFASRQRNPDRRALLIFLMGRANQHDGTFGVGRDDDFTPNNRVFEVLREAGQAYGECRSSRRMRVDIAYGLTNYELSESIQTNGSARQAGLAQARVVKKLNRRLPRGVGAATAGDIEPGWDPGGSGRALNLVRGGAGEGPQYFNFGTAGQCPPFGTACQGNWTPTDIARGSQDQGVIPLPQIYYPRQAQTWGLIANRWDRLGGNCPKRKRKKNGCYDFGGATSHPTGCAGVEFTPEESWRRLRQATDNRVGRRLIYFNPHRVSCRSVAEEPSPVTQTDVSLPLMPNDVPGEIIQDPDPVVSEYVMGSLVNAWRAGSARELIWVYAGAAGPDPSTGEPSSSGRLLVVRERYSRDRPPSTSTEQIDIAGEGPLRIVEAPSGHRAINSARGDGVIAFESTAGAEGLLDLSASSVSLTSEP